MIPANNLEEAKKQWPGEGQTLSEVKKIRWAWLKFMYITTVIVAGGFGLGMLFAPGVFRFDKPCDPLTSGVVGSVFLAFALLSILGIRSPLKFVPVLLLQLTYKAIWVIGSVLPLLITGDNLSSAALINVGVFIFTIIGDLIAIPFSYIFGRDSLPLSDRSTMVR